MKRIRALSLVSPCFSPVAAAEIAGGRVLVRAISPLYLRGRVYSDANGRLYPVSWRAMSDAVREISSRDPVDQLDSKNDSQNQEVLVAGSCDFQLVPMPRDGLAVLVILASTSSQNLAAALCLLPAQVGLCRHVRGVPCWWYHCCFRTAQCVRQQLTPALKIGARNR